MAESKLNIIIDSRSAEQKAKDLTRVLEALEQAGIRVSRTLSGQVSGHNANAAAAGRASTSVGTLTSSTNAYTAATARAGAGNHAMRASLVGMAAGAVSAATAYAGFKALLNITDEYKVMEGQIRLVTESQAELTSVMRQLTAMSQAAGGELSASVELYAKFSNASRDLSGTTSAVLVRLTDLVNKFVAIGGSSGASAAAGIFQFSQAMASGVLRGQEYNSILEQTPGLAKALADGLGVSMGMMRSMANDGKLTADVVMNALLKMGDVADEQFGSMSRTSKQAFTIVRRQIAEVTNEIDRNVGSSTAFIKIVESLKTKIESISFQVQTGELNLLTTAIRVLTTIALKNLLTGLAASATALYEKVVASRAATLATQQQAMADAQAARTAVIAAQGDQARAVMAAQAARAAVMAAESKVFADKQVMTSEIQRMNSTRAQLQIEKALEVQRLGNQISEQGRQMSIARMAQLRQVEVAVTRELQAAEAQLTATSVAGAEAVTAAKTAEAAAIARVAAATEAGTVANGRYAASQAAVAASTNTVALATKGLLGFFGGPIGLIVTLAAVAGGIWMAVKASDAMKLSVDKLGDSVEDAAKKFEGLGYAQRQYLLSDAASKNQDNIDALKKAQRGFIESVASASLEQDNAGRGRLQALLKEVEAGTINYTEAMRRIESQGMIRSDGLFGDRAISRVRSRAAALEELSVATARYAARTQALVIANKAAEQAAIERTKAEAAAKANKGDITLANQFEKGDAEAAELAKTMRDRLAAAQDPSAYAATLRALKDLSDAGKPVSDAMRKQLLDIASAQDAVTASQSRGKIETRQAIKDQKELARELERRRDAYAELVADSASPEVKVEDEFKQRKALIDEFAGRSNGKHTEMTNWALQEAKRETGAIFLARQQALAKYANLNATEIEQIKSKYAFERSEVDLMITYTVEQRRKMREALDQAERKEIADSTNALRASFDERYRIELEFNNRIKAIDQSNMSDPEKEMAANVARNVNNDAITGLNKPYTDMMAEVGGESPELLRLKADEEAKMLIIRDALTQRHITEEEAAAARLQIEKNFMTSRNDLMLSQGEQMLGSMTSIMKSLGGEQSKAYKVMFAIEKGVSIARSIMAIQTGIAMASANPFPMNLGAMASVAAATANIVGSLQSVKMAGQAHDGIDYVPKEGTWLLDKGERVLSPKQNSDLTNYMQRDGKATKSDTMVTGGGLNVTIQNYGTSKQFDVQQISESEVRIIARDEIAKDGGKAAAASMSNPNSDLSKAMGRNLQVERNRS